MKAIFALAVILMLSAVGCQKETAAPQPQGKQLWTCSMHPQVIQDHPGNCPICHMKLVPMRTEAPSTLPTTQTSMLTIDPVMVQNMGVRVAEVRRGPLRQTVRAVGYLDEPESAARDITLKIGGWIEKLYADTEGAHVMKGEPLFDLYSPELQIAIEELIAAGKSGDAADVLLHAARRKLEAWGLDEAEIERLAKLDSAPRTVTFRSPFGGHVVAKDVVAGASVQPGQRILRLSDNSTMWLDVQVFERQLSFVQTGQKVVATVEAAPGERFEGKVMFVHPHLDEMTRAAMVRVSLPNPERTLRKGMYATAEIVVDEEKDAVLVPREAVIDTGKRQIVFVSRHDGHFEPRDVQMGAAGADGMVEILGDALKPGEQAVTSGQFLLDSESRIQEAIQKHLSHGMIAR